MELLEEQLAEFPVISEIPVQWGEMDAAGHVNNVVYLRWFESARVDYLDRLGQDVVFNEQGGPGFILAKQDCKYLFALVYPDTVICAIRVEELLEDRMIMQCRMFSKQHHRLVAIANCSMVTFDYHQRSKVPIPEDLRNGITTLEGERLTVATERP